MNPHKHGWTQGPWTHAEGSRTGAVWAGKDFIASVYPNAPEGWDGFSPYAEEAECKANACLVAASPVMAEVIIDFIDHIDASDLDDLDFGRGLASSGLIERFRAALLKAKAPAEGEVS